MVAENGDILFVSNREADPDRVFNYDVFAASAASGEVRRLTNTKSAEYRPVWSPDGKSIAYLGTRRTLTSSETTMEDTHVWVMNAARRQPARAGDDRQSPGAAAVVARMAAASTSPCRNAATSASIACPSPAGSRARRAGSRRARQRRIVVGRQGLARRRARLRPHDAEHAV